MLCVEVCRFLQLKALGRTCTQVTRGRVRMRRLRGAGLIFDLALPKGTGDMDDSGVKLSAPGTKY